MNRVKSRTPRTKAVEATETQIQVTKGQQGEVYYVSGSAGPYFSIMDGVNNGPFARVAKHNISSSSPTVDDDVDRSYSYFSMWINSSSAVLWTCVDPASGAAVWKALN